MDQIEKDRQSAKNDGLNLADIMSLFMFISPINDVFVPIGGFWLGMLMTLVILQPPLWLMARYRALRPTTYAPKWFVIFMALVVPLVLVMWID